MAGSSSSRALLAILLATLTILLLAPSPEMEPAHGFGWVPNPAAAESLAAALPLRFDATPAFQASYAGPEDVFLWDACRSVTGELLPPRDQGSVGACVGFGTAAAIEHLCCVQAAEVESEAYRELSPEIIYAGSRVEIGRNAIRGDGSVGAWAAKFVNTFGVLPRGRYPNLDLTTYDPRRCRMLGRSGVPDELEGLVKAHPVKSIANVRSFREARAAIRNGYPMIVCSSQGFVMERDSDGFCKPQGVWMHCMAVIGIRGGVRPGAFLLNSWGGKAHTGPCGLGDPSPAGFWADADVVDRMLRQGDSWAFSQFSGFPAKPVGVTRSAKAR